MNESAHNPIGGALRPVDGQPTESVGFNMEDFKDVLASAPGVLLANQTSARKCVEYGNTLIEKAKAAPENNYYAEVSSFVAKAKKTLAVTNENRKPFTVLLDKVKKCFTESENGIKDVIQRATAVMDEYARREAEEKRKREEEALRKQEAANARIRIEQEMTVQIENRFLKMVDDSKRSLLALLSNATLETLNLKQASVDGFPVEFPQDFIDISGLLVNSVFVTAEEQTRMADGILARKMDGYRNTYREEVAAYREIILSRFPSKRAELEEMQKADEAKRAELEALRQQREAEEEARRQREAEEARNRAAQEAEMQANAQRLSATIDNQASLFAQPAVNAKETIRVEVKHAAGYLLLAQLWFENEGKDMPLDKVEKMTFKRIAAWAEKVADEKRVQSEFVKYETVYKAK